MAYVNNGTSRSLRVSVTKTLGGVTVQGYPKTYDGQNYWGNPTYPTLTDTQMSQLSESDFVFRYTSFVEYVESVEAGVDFTYDVVGDGATKSDANCLTTTTTRPVTTTTTTVAEAVGMYNITVWGRPSEPTTEVANVYYSINNGPDIYLGNLGTNLCHLIGVISAPYGSVLHVGVLNEGNECVNFNAQITTVQCPDTFTGYCGTANTCGGYTLPFAIVASYPMAITADCTGETYQTCT